MNLPLSFSQSSLQDYADCHRRFELRYLERLTYPAVEAEPALENERHQQAGEIFHRMAQQYLLGIPADSLGRLADAQRYPLLATWWQNWLAFAREQDFIREQVREPEVTLSAPLGAFRLLAKYDLLVVRDGKATIFDWKTARKRTLQDRLAARWQTRVYRAVLAQAGAQFNGGQPFAPQNIEMIYWFADFPDDPAHFVYSAAQMERDWVDLKRIVTEIVRPDRKFEQTTATRACDYCVYRSYCARGVRAGDDPQAEFEPEIRLSESDEVEV